MARICVVDDSDILRESVAESLRREDHRVTMFDDPVEALASVKRVGFDLIVSDLKMPRMDGVQLVRELRAGGCDTPVIMMTAFATVSTAVEAMKAGAYDYLQKPFDTAALNVLVERALEHDRLSRENEALRKSVEDFRKPRNLAGDSQVMQALREELTRVAASHATVLVSGESGTGKELVASFIHAHSPRADRPLLCLNCAALSASLLESELFGHERGAFTGADRTRKGRFELADGGTLLLDEISEMALGLQAKLLRVLQEGEFERVGSSVTRRADVRVIATTNRDLKEWVNKRRFREDLFYRLNVLPVTVAPLRERIEDVAGLVAYFVGRAVTSHDQKTLQFSPQAMKLLNEYHWPGNVRELENVCERALTIREGNVITGETIEPWLRAEARTMTEFGPLREGRMLQDMERQLIEKTLARYSGHRAKSAKALGMGVRTLGLKIKQWREEAAATNAAVAVY